MPYKIRVTKKCSECGQVLESVRDDYCDGCGIQISQKDYDRHIKIGFLTGGEGFRVDMVFHSLDCFQRNIGKLDLKGITNLSIEYMTPAMWKRVAKLLKLEKA